MRKSLVLATLLVMCCSMTAFAGVPDPSRSGTGVSGGASCQFRFRSDGGLDCMTVSVTLRDAFDTLVPNCSTSVTVQSAGAGTLAYCNCCASRQAGFTGLDGVFVVEYCKIGGRGTLDVCVTAHCQGNVAIGCTNIGFTSPDLNGSCEASASVNVIDLGIWAGGIPNGLRSNYNCDATVNVIDLGIWAGGLGIGCSSGAACP